MNPRAPSMSHIFTGCEERAAAATGGFQAARIALSSSDGPEAGTGDNPTQADDCLWVPVEVPPIWGSPSGSVVASAMRTSWTSRTFTARHPEALHESIDNLCS